MGHVDYTEFGNGHKVVLLHSSASNMRQWQKLVDTFSDQFHFIMINLIGYGNTTPWSKTQPQRLEDQVQLLKGLPIIKNDHFSIVGHSFGASVAMKAAQYFGEQIKNLILIEPNPFYLLKYEDKQEVYNEAFLLSQKIKMHYQKDWMEAVRYFAEYWRGKDSWNKLSLNQKEKFAQILKPNYHEWDPVLNEKTSISEWRVSLPKQTCLITARDTVRTIKELTKFFKKYCPNWNFETIKHGGHMAPVTNFEIVNPIIIKNLM